ncbi:MULTISPECIES: class I adenylate-forming enzyme family protein [unclassified Leisingera]|uniref:class I adenylate-forming enzyme family protein n=1 Tax=unclassified Leisingera TaxID=2614906 RepID=UPI0002D94EAB|nr:MULTISPECIES: class I adenylate-forming enzyme family protein [unclassified Leisingera]KIC26689.1 benzoate--CoA ligase [Leisingera sp. ANG-S3]KIC48301.1 benzoate--CoA ligase [Leisingera sp. ANG-S]KID10406.1 benzoate--CoA ligase [Leisingera sp. ANG1]
MLSVFDQGPFAPCPSPFNLAAHVLRHAARLAGKTALSVLDGDAPDDWSYARLEAAVRGTGTGMLRAGLVPGDIVLMRLGNTVEFPVAYLGAIAAGLIPVPTSSQLTEAETARMISDLDPAAVLRDPAVACASHPKQISTEALLDMHGLPPCEYAMGDPKRLAYVVYTSGTSGNPRAVAHAHQAVWARQMMVDGWYGLTEHDRLLHAGAFNWTYTLGTGLMDPWAAGATALIPAPGTPLEDLPALLQKHRATIFAAAPGVYRKFLSGNALDLPDLRHGLCAGEKLSRHLHEAWEAATGCGLYEAFGMSECSTFISSSPAHPAQDGALGQPQPGRRVAIVGMEGPVPVDEEGTIAIHRSDPGLMLGYLGAPEETAARYQGDWFLTGDQGAMSADGQIRYLGRSDDMMNAGGYRVSPIEVETALAAHPGITQAGAAAVEVKEDTYIIAAFYTGPEELKTEDLQAFASERLARYKQPRAYVHLDALPTGANGKLLRRALPALFKG